MKNIVFLFLYVSMMYGVSISQEPGKELDPLMGSYILGNSAEIILQSAPVTGDHGWQMYDYDNDGAELFPVSSTLYMDSTTRIAGDKAMVIATGDLNGDRHDNIVAAWEGENKSIIIYIPGNTTDSTGWENGNVTIIDSVFSSELRLFTGDFDRDRQKEFVLAYAGLDGNVHIELYQTDSMLVLEKITDIADFSLNNWPLFDLTTGDFDGDGLDEIVLMHHSENSYIGNTCYRDKFNVKVYDYAYQDQTFIPKSTNEISMVNCYDGSNVWSNLKRIKIATGNFDNDIMDEVAYMFGINYISDLGIGGGRITHFTNGIFRFSIDPLMDQVLFDEHVRSMVSSWGSANGDLREKLTMSLECRDLNGDGIDEVIGLGSRNLAVFTKGEGFSLNTIANIPANGRYNSGQFQQLLVVEDLDADTSATQKGVWNPEIVYLDFENDPFRGVLQNLNVPGKARLWVTQAVLGDLNEITGISDPVMLATEIDGNTTQSLVLKAGDFNGDAVRLGKPRLFSQEQVFQPTVILNAPPVHFDIIDNTPYDVNYSFNENDPEFESSYTYVTTQQDQAATEIHADWGVSTTISAERSFLGFGASASLTSKYGEGFNKSNSYSETVVIEETADARVDDWIYGTVTDYSFWEYPVYFKGEKYGHIMAVIPYFRGKEWFTSKGAEVPSYIHNHEVGNLLSYPNYSKIENNPDLAKTIVQFSSNPINGTSSPEWKLNKQVFTDQEVQTSWEFGMSINTSVWGGGFSFSASANYEQGEINTHKVTIGDEFLMTINMSDVDTKIGEVAYSVMPYAYRSVNGALVIDYNIELPESNPGNPPTWWQNQYGNKADPAFILPWLYDPEKGDALEEERKRYLTRNITFNPSRPQIGDTVQIQTRIKNYSLVDTESPVTVRFYREDPDDGGTAIESIYGEKEVSSPSIIAGRGEAIVQMTWELPADISEYTRIYAVIDPENETPEIHENNNKAYSVLSIYGATAIDETMANITPDDFTLYQNYPNPFNPMTVIEFSLQTASFVEIEVFNTLGERVDIIASKHLQAGKHSYNFDGRMLPSGLYFYRIKAGNFHDVKKMILLR